MVTDSQFVINEKNLFNILKPDNGIELYAGR